MIGNESGINFTIKFAHITPHRLFTIKVFFPMRNMNLMTNRMHIQQTYIALRV